VRDCLQEAMDFEGLCEVLRRVHRGEVRLLARDTPEPSAFACAILNARPFAFMDDAPLEERRAHAVQTRRGHGQLEEGAVLDAAAVDKVRQEAAPDPRDADELHDALMTCGVLTARELEAFDPGWMSALVAAGRAVGISGLTLATERLPEWQAVHPGFVAAAGIVVPPARVSRAWTGAGALTELVRGRMTMSGPVTAAALAQLFGVPESRVNDALLALEAEGVVLRGVFTAAAGTEWCDRALLARIHRYTLNRLRAEIEPVSPADFMRFLFKWQHVDEIARLTGPDGLKQVLERLDGFEAAARAWERSILPARLERYEPSLLDMACLSGDVRWGRASAPGVLRTTTATPIALVATEHADAWLAASDRPEPALSDDARLVVARLRERGPLFFRDLAAGLSFDPDRLRIALSALVAAGIAASDGFAGLRVLMAAERGRPWPLNRRPNLAGRWNLLSSPRSADRPSADIEIQAWSLLQRYGIVFRRLLTRETAAAPWRELARVYRRLEARGEIRGGRFVAGMAGEQFALPDAIPVLREVRRTPPSGAFYSVSTADPLNLAGIVTAGARVAARGRNRIAYRDGVPVAVFESQVFRPLEPLSAEDTAEALDVMSARILRHRKVAFLRGAP
jgi:ATP-dependent helicase Lhr and Lhr-like helicase